MMTVVYTNRNELNGMRRQEELLNDMLTAERNRATAEKKILENELQRAKIAASQNTCDAATKYGVSLLYYLYWTM